MDSCSPRNFGSGAQLSGGPTFCPEKRDSCTPETLAPNMCLEKWTVVPPDKLDSGAQLSGGPTFCNEKRDRCTPRNFSSGAQLSGGAQISVLEKKGDSFTPDTL